MRDLNEMLSREITEMERFELMVGHMCKGGDWRFQRTFCTWFEKATDEQKVTFLQAYRLGWYLSKILKSRTTHKIAWAMYANGCTAWVTPDGVIHRAEPGKRTAYLKHSDWVDV